MRYFAKTIRIILWTILGYLFLASIKPGIAQEKPIGPILEPERYRLSPQLNINNEFTVEEEQKWDGNTTITTKDKIHQSAFLKSTHHKYTEKIVGIGQAIKSKRTYTLSRVKSILPQEGIKRETTSLERKTLMLETVNHQIKVLENLTKENPTILKDDLPYITPLIEFKGVLPKTMVKEGDTWTIGTRDLGRMIFKNNYDEKKCLIKGEGVFKEIVNYPDGDPGAPCAKILLQLMISHDGTETASILETNLDGICFCSLETGLILFLELRGQFTLKRERKQDDLITVVTSGNITIRKKLN